MYYIYIHSSNPPPSPVFKVVTINQLFNRIITTSAMYKAVNFEDPLSEFELAFYDFIPEEPTNIAATTKDIADKTPSLFINANNDFDFDLNNWTSEESTNTSLVNSPTNNFKQLNSKNSLLGSPLQDYHEINPTTVNSRLFDNHNETQGNNDIFMYDYTTNKPKKNKYRVNKPSSSSPLLRLPLKPSVTIANIGTLSRLEVKSCKAAIPKTNVGNPFYKSPMETKSKSSTDTCNNNNSNINNSNINNCNDCDTDVENDFDNEDDQVIYDLLVDGNILNKTNQLPILETKFVTFDDNLIFDDLLDNQQDIHPFIKDNIPWRV